METFVIPPKNKHAPPFSAARSKCVSGRPWPPWLWLHGCVGSNAMTHRLCQFLSHQCSPLLSLPWPVLVSSHAPNLDFRTCRQ